jgi:hypothetical protein
MVNAMVAPLLSAKVRVFNPSVAVAMTVRLADYCANSPNNSIKITRFSANAEYDRIVATKEPFK